MRAVSKPPTIWPLIAASVASALLARICLYPVNWWFCAFFVWSPLLLAGTNQSRRARGVAWFGAGTLANVLGFHFVPSALHEVADWTLPSGIGILIAMAGVQSLHLLAVGLLLPPGRAAFFWFPMLLAGSEALMAGPFPWHLATLLQGTPLLCQLAAYGGPLVLSLAIATVNSLVALSVFAPRENWKIFLPLPVFVMLSVGGLRFRQFAIESQRASSPGVKIGIIQGWYSATQLRGPDITPSYRKRSLMLLAEHPDVEFLIWPEAASTSAVSPHSLGKTATDLWFSDGGGPFVSERIDVPVLLGTPYREKPQTLYNSAIFVSPRGQELGRYDKRNLVPLGERDVTLGSVHIESAFAFTAGTVSRAIEWKEHRFLPLICVEDIFSRAVQKAVAEVKPTILLSLTSDAWFSSAAARNLHFELSRLRAIETGLPLLRVTNRGVSVLLDPLGRVSDRLSDGLTSGALKISGSPLSTWTFPFDERWLSWAILFLRGGWSLKTFRTPARSPRARGRSRARPQIGESDKMSPLLGSGS